MEKELTKPAPKVTEISYRKVRNLGNYETETIEVKAVVEDDQNPAEVLAYLRTWTKHRFANPEDENIEQVS